MVLASSLSAPALEVREDHWDAFAEQRVQLSECYCDHLMFAGLNSVQRLCSAFTCCKKGDQRNIHQLGPADVMRQNDTRRVVGSGRKLWVLQEKLFAVTAIMDCRNKRVHQNQRPD